jgi:nucleoside-diphosphate-sugar epimerase
MMKITVIGCGWLGMPLAQRFVEAGMEVSGTVRTVDKLDQLSDLGIRPILYSGSISQELIVGLQTTDLLIICFPPSGSPDYAAQITQLIDIVSEKTQVIFTSSTGVYKDIESWIDESGDVLTDHPVFLAESVIREKCAGRFSILRLSGLFGSGRHPVKYLAGRQGIRNGLAPVNLVHLRDVIQAILTVTDENLYGKTYNLSYPEHPTKKEYYTEMAHNLNLHEPMFDEDQTGGKCVNGDKIIQESNFNYCFGLYEP